MLAFKKFGLSFLVAAVMTQGLAGASFADGLLDRALDKAAPGEKATAGGADLSYVRNSTADPALHVGLKVDHLRRHFDKYGDLSKRGMALGFDVNYDINLDNGGSLLRVPEDQRDGVSRQHISLYYDPIVKFQEGHKKFSDGVRVHLLSLGYRYDDNKIVDAKSSAAKIGVLKTYGSYENFCAFVVPSILLGKHEIHQKNMKTFGFETEVGACLHDREKRALVTAGMKLGVFSDHDDSTTKGSVISEKYVDVKLTLHKMQDSNARIYTGMTVSDDVTKEPETGEYRNRKVMFGVGVRAY